MSGKKVSLICCATVLASKKDGLAERLGTRDKGLSGRKHASKQTTVCGLSGIAANYARLTQPSRQISLQVARSNSVGIVVEDISVKLCNTSSQFCISSRYDRVHSLPN
jgi:hypothetical protein